MTKPGNPREYVLHMVDKHANSKEAKANNRPGMPTSFVAGIDYCDAAYRELLADGVLEIVERPSAVNPARASSFVRRAAR